MLLLLGPLTLVIGQGFNRKKFETKIVTLKTSFLTVWHNKYNYIPIANSPVITIPELKPVPKPNLTRVSSSSTSWQFDVDKTAVVVVTQLGSGQVMLVMFPVTQSTIWQKSEHRVVVVVDVANKDIVYNYVYIDRYICMLQ